jgi:hypothetical protein
MSATTQILATNDPCMRGMSPPNLRAMTLHIKAATLRAFHIYLSRLLTNFRTLATHTEKPAARPMFNCANYDAI